MADTDWDVVGSTAPSSGAPAADDWGVAATSNVLPGWERIPLGLISNAAQGVANIAGLPGDAASFESGGIDKASSYINGGSVPAWSSTVKKALLVPPQGALPTTADVDRWGTNAGLFNRPELTPQSEIENIANAGVRGAGTGVMFGAPGVISGATGGMGSRVGQDMMPDHPVIGALLGGLAGGGIPSLVSGGARAVRTLAGESGPVTADYDLLGIKPRLAGDVSGSPAMQMVQTFAAKNPFGAGRVHDAASATMGEFGTAVDNTAAMLGADRTLQDAGTTLQGASRRWMDNFKAQNTSNWNALDQYVPASTPVAVPGYAAALDNIAATLPKARATANILQPAMSRNLKTALTADLAKSGGTLPWSTVKNIRTRIGEMLSDPNLPADTDTAELKRVYGGLSVDMQGAVSAAGAPAEAAFATASDFTKNGHAFIDGILKPFIQKGATPEQAATTALNAANNGGSKLAAIRAEMPDAADALGAFKIRDMGLATAGAQNATGDASSAGSFLTDLNRMSPEAQSALFATPDVQARLQALARVSDGIKKTSKFLNTSNTGAHTTMQGLLSRFGAALGGYGGGHAIAGPTGALMGAIAPFADVPVAMAGARAVTSPFITRMMSLPQKSYFSGPANAAAVFNSLPPNQQNSLLQ